MKSIKSTTLKEKTRKLFVHKQRNPKRSLTSTGEYSKFETSTLSTLKSSLTANFGISGELRSSSTLRKKHSQANSKRYLRRVVKENLVIRSRSIQGHVTSKTVESLKNLAKSRGNGLYPDRPQKMCKLQFCSPDWLDFMKFNKYLCINLLMTKFI